MTKRIFGTGDPSPTVSIKHICRGRVSRPVDILTQDDKHIILLNDLNPAFRGLDAAHLDAGEGLVQLLNLGAEACVVV